ncbi:MAG: pilus assembly protein PilM [Candidatus Omnitrophica bacterium]|nr:pilus assembly protein PilM [Candidatus Omnitrophota bacterium]
MSPKKIDSKKVVSRIFGDTLLGKKKRPGAETIPSLLGYHGKKQTAPKEKLSPISPIRFIWSGWQNEFGGLDMGSDSIKFVLLVQERRRLRLKDLQVEKLIHMDRKAKPEELEKATLDAITKIASRLKPKTKLGISLNDPSLFMDSLTVPRGSEQEVQDIIRRELSEKHLIDPNSSFIDHTTLNGSESSSPTQELLVVAAPRELVYRQFERAQATGFKVLSVETNALACLQALRRIKRWDAKDRVLILDIGAAFSNVSVGIGDRITFNRIIPIAGERWTKAVQETVGCDFEKAEQLKIRYGLKQASPSSQDNVLSGTIPEGTIPEATIPEGEKVSQILMAETEKLLDEVERSFQFALTKETNEEGARLNHVFLMGGGARLLALKEHIEKRWGVPVRQLDLWEGIALDEQTIDREFLNETRDIISVSLGIALRVTEWSVLPFGFGMPA